jgi:hypothetical protein
MVSRHLPARSSFRLARTAPSRLVLACALALSAWSACAATPAVLMQAPVLDAVADAVPEGGMWPVRLDLARLRAARSGDTLRFALPDGARLDVVFDSTIDQPDGVQWIGHLAAGRQFPVRLRLDGALASGVIRTPDGGYVLGHVDGRQLVGADLAAQADPVTVESLPAMFAPSVVVLDEARGTPRSADEPEPRKPADVAHPVTVDLVAMSALEPGADMALSIPDHGDYRVAYDRTEPGDTDSTTWVGHLKDYGPEFRVIITSGPNGSVGNILTPSGEILLVSDGGSQWLVDPQRSGLSQLEPDHADAVGEVVAGGPMEAEGAAGGGPTAAAASSTTTAGSATTPTTQASASATTVDVLVLYTAGFKTRNGSLWATRIAQLVALSNQAYIDSGVAMRVRLVGSELVGEPDTTSNSNALTALARGTGNFAGVPALRKKLGADLVTLVRPFNMNAQGGNCGVGYVGGYNGAPVSAYAAYGYSVVSDGRDVAGTGYYCTDYTFTHELGHNMGLMHDRDTVARQGGGKGSHDYAFGFGRSGSFGSVMSYISPVIGRFSNPDQKNCGGSFACGTPVGTPNSAHNTLALRNNRSAIAAFSPAMVAGTFQISGTISSAGKPVAGVALSASNGGNCTPSGSTGAWACVVPQNWSGVITPNVPAGRATPGNFSFSKISAAQTGRNFVLPGQTISGTITQAGKALPNAAVTAGNGVSCSATDSSGTYRCTVPWDWSGTVTPAMPAGSVTPTSRTLNAVRTTQNGLNFVVTTVQISGTVTRAGKPVAKLVMLGSSGASCSASAANGSYACTVPKGWSGIILPSAAANPPHLSVTAVKAAQPGRNFALR